MVTPGYVTEPLHTAPSIEEIPLAVDGMVESIATFETEDVIRFVKDSENGDSSPYVECLGREGDLIKVGGAFAAIPALEGTISQKFGSGTKVYLMVAHEVLGGEIHVVVQVGYECRLSVPEAIAAVRGSLPSIPTECMHFLVPDAWIPTNSVTGKVLKSELLSMVIAKLPPVPLANDAIPEDASYREAYELGGGLSVKSAARSKKALYVGVPLHILIIFSISILASICWNSVQPVRLILSILAALMVYYPLLDYGAITVQSDTAPVFGSSIDTKDCLERMAMRWAEVCLSLLLWLDNTFPYGAYFFKASLAVIMGQMWWGSQMFLLVILLKIFTRTHLRFWPTISTIEAGVYLCHDWRWRNWQPYLLNPLRLLCWYMYGMFSWLDKYRLPATSRLARFIIRSRIARYAVPPRRAGRTRTRGGSPRKRDRWYRCEVARCCKTKGNSECWFRESHGEWRWIESDKWWSSRNKKYDALHSSSRWSKFSMCSVVRVLQLFTQTSIRNASQRTIPFGKADISELMLTRLGAIHISSPRFICESCIWDRMKCVDVNLAGGRSRPPARRPPKSATRPNTPVDDGATASNVRGQIVRMLSSLNGGYSDTVELADGGRLIELSSLSIVILCGRISQKWNIKVRRLVRYASS